MKSYIRPMTEEEKIKQIKAHLERLRLLHKEAKGK